MSRTVEAVIDKDGRIRLLEKVDVVHAKRVLVTFLEDDETLPEGVADTALLSEAALAEDWNRAEEDEAWRHLQ